MLKWYLATHMHIVTWKFMSWHVELEYSNTRVHTVVSKNPIFGQSFRKGSNFTLMSGKIHMTKESYNIHWLISATRYEAMLLIKCMLLS